MIKDYNTISFTNGYEFQYFIDDQKIYVLKQIDISRMSSG